MLKSYLFYIFKILIVKMNLFCNDNIWGSIGKNDPEMPKPIRPDLA